MHSALYRGWVRHRRFTDARHAFRYALFMVYLDLAELDHVFARRWLWSARRPAVAKFCREDHLGDPATPLDTAVRDLVHQSIGQRPRGPIRLLTHLRYFGYAINPVSFYFCLSESEEQLEALVLEVTNTPWGERHCYVVAAAKGQRVFTFDKAFHVSPFMPLDHQYRCHISGPGRHLVVHLENWRAETKQFDATLALQRQPMRTTAMTAALIRFPAMTLQVLAGIYWQAFKLWAKGTRYYPHPNRAANEKEAVT